MTMENQRPSEVFLALWRDRAVRNSSTVEEFAELAEVWQQIRELEEVAARERRRRSGQPEPWADGIFQYIEKTRRAVETPAPEEGTAADVSESDTTPAEEPSPAAPREQGTVSLGIPGEKDAGNQDDKGAAGSALEGFALVEPPKLSGPWSSYKNEILDRLERARREDKLKLADVVKASDGKLTDMELMDMISRSRKPMAKWDVLSAALVKLGYPAPEGVSPPPFQERSGVNEP